MKILQISMTHGQDCGISIFAGNLQAQLKRHGADVVTLTMLPPEVQADLVLLQHHKELMSDAKAISLVETSRSPVVLFAHSEDVDDLCGYVDGVISMCPGIIGPTDKPFHIFPHPAWVPSHLEERGSLRREFNLPLDRFIVASNGFLKFERQYVEIIETLLPEARRNNWFIALFISPWRLDSPGLVPRLEKIQVENPNHFSFEYSFLDTISLNRRLQACDLLWCWTKAGSSPYASGVISDQYGSGTRILAADKQQHRHVLGLPNTVAGPNFLTPFVDQLIAEIQSGIVTRHDPALISWDNHIHRIQTFFEELFENVGKRGSDADH